MKNKKIVTNLFRYFMLAVLFFEPVNATDNCQNVVRGEEAKQVVVSAKDARIIAEQYFLEKTRGYIAKYKITLINELILADVHFPADDKEKLIDFNTFWIFSFEGIDESSGPGKHWDVIINKTTGEIIFLAGE